MLLLMEIFTEIHRGITSIASSSRPFRLTSSAYLSIESVNLSYVFIHEVTVSNQGLSLVGTTSDTRMVS
jgi:hypothetical protein